jgi:amidohydrolase
MVLTAALALAEERDSLRGSVKFLFQPDEEGAGGAKILIRGGALKNVEAIFGIHVNPRLPAGTIGIKPGPLMASVDRFTIDILGEGGHGAYPHEGRDAVVIAAQVVSALQTLASRRIDPVDPVVVTIGTIEGGRRFNVLAESVRMTGTVRTLSHDLQRRMPGLMEEVIAGVTKAHGARYKLDYEVLGHPLVNDAQMAALATEAAERAVGRRNVLRLDRPSMGGEDFSEYLDRVPGCFAYLGTGADQRTKRPWHHPSFFLHEGSLEVGVKFLCALARESLVRLCS